MAAGEIGFINPVSEPFCSDCNRIRLTADGRLRTCLFSIHETDLRGPLRAGAGDDELEAIVRDAVWQKELKHHVGEPGFRQPARIDERYRRLSGCTGSPAASSPGSTTRRYMPGPTRVGEALHELRVARLRRHLLARLARLGDLERHAARRPAVARPRGVHVHPAQREVLAEEARAQLAPELGLPPLHVLDRVGVDGLVLAAVHAAVGLHVALEAQLADGHRALDRAP